MMELYRYRAIKKSDADALREILEESTGSVSEKKITALLNASFVNANSIYGAITDNNEVVAFAHILTRDGVEETREHYISNAVEISYAKRVEDRMYKYILDNQQKAPTDKEVTATIIANKRKYKY